MITGQNILVFSDEWGRHPFSCQHIMKYFLPHNNLIWVTPTGMRNPTLSWYDVKRSVEKLKVIFADKENKIKELNRPKSITPFAIPYSQFGIIRMLNKQFVIRAIHRNCSYDELKQPIVISTLPITGDYINSFRNQISVYYCVDDFVNWPGIDRLLMKSLEDQLIINSDVLIVSSDELAKIKQTDSNKPVVIPHGVDVEHYSHAESNNRFDEITKPVIGFFGAISPWLDLDLLYEMAIRKQEWSLVFIGPCDTDVSRFIKLENVHFVGKVPYEELPSYAVQFDVGIIPFLINDLTISVNPLKLLEYLACGIPVVSTDLPEVRKFADHVYISLNVDDFIGFTEKALAENSVAMAKKRREIALSYSWAAIAETFSNTIEDALTTRKLT